MRIFLGVYFLIGTKDAEIPNFPIFQCFQSGPSDYPGNGTFK